MILQCVINLPINPFDELGTELHGPVVLDDLILDEIEGEVARVTDPFLLSSAEEVEVLAAESSDGALDQHPLVDQSTLRVALAAPEGALEVVRINSLTLPGPPRCFESLLDADEQVAVDDCGVASLKGLALIDDVTDVVRVAQHCRDLRAGDRPCWSASCSARFQSAIGQDVSDVLHRELALVEEIECQLDERCAFLVDRDTAKLTAFDAFESVDVADGRFPERSAILGFLPHFVGDVRSVFAGSVLVERGEDPMHELPDRGRIDRLRGRDQCDPALLEVSHDDCIVRSVTGKAGELVDDHVVDILFAAYAFEHLLEGHALAHLSSGDSCFDVLGDHGQAELLGLALAGHPLSGN